MDAQALRGQRQDIAAEVNHISDGLNQRLEFSDANALASGVVLLTYRAG